MYTVKWNSVDIVNIFGTYTVHYELFHNYSNTFYLILQYGFSIPYLSLWDSDKQIFKNVWIQLGERKNASLTCNASHIFRELRREKLIKRGTEMCFDKRILIWNSWIQINQ